MPRRDMRTKTQRAITAITHGTCFKAGHVICKGQTVKIKFEHVQGLENIPGRRRVPMHESGVPYSFSLARCRVRGL